MAISCSVEFRGAKEFQAQFVNLAHRATQRVGLKTMNYIEDGDFPQGFTDALLFAAATPGVRTHFTFDSSSYVCPDGNDSSLLPVAVRSRRWSEEVLEQKQRTLDRLDEMKAAGVDVRSTNPLKLVTGQFPFLKRDHRKVAVVDETGWVVDVNLNQAPRDHPAIIYETREPELVDYLYSVVKGEDNPKMAPRDSFGHQLISDSGMVLSSSIYDRAKQIAEAKGDFIFVGSQLLPGIGLVSHLVDACRAGSKVVLVTSDQGKFRRLPYKFFYDALKAGISGLKNFDLLHYPDYMHAKFLETPSAALTGSSNLALPGILFGTQELDVHIKNETTLRKLHERVEDIVRKSVSPT